MFVSSFKSKGVFMAVRIERMTLHSWSPMFFIFFFFFFNWPDSYYSEVRNFRGGSENTSIPVTQG